jgi:hypothetical protein
VRLGAVEVLRSYNLRASLIGGAPLLSGMIVLGLIGWLVFNGANLTSALGRGDIDSLVRQLFATTRAADALVWFYIIFAVANSMMPSPSDTQAWPPVLGFVALIVAIALLVGGAGFVQAIKPPLEFTLRWLAASLAITAFVDILVIAVLWLLARLIELVTNRRIEYK